MPELLCFLIDASLLCLTLLILYSIKPVPLYIGKWEIKRPRPPRDIHAQALWQLYEFHFELTPDGQYFIDSDVYKKHLKYNVVGGGEYLIIDFSKTLKPTKDYRYTSSEAKIMLGEMCDILIFKILKAEKDIMKLQNIPFTNSTNKLPFAFQIRRQEIECNKNKVKMHEVTLHRIPEFEEQEYPYRSIFPLHNWTDILPKFIQPKDSKKDIFDLLK